MSESVIDIRQVTVYCSSSEHLDPSYHTDAATLGRLLAEQGWGLVYGGGSVGLMGEVARSCRDAGGHVTGIITERLRDAEQMETLNHENLVVKTMRERKQLLEVRGDAFVILPGGLGTLEEFFEILVGRLLGEHDKPIVILNLDEPGAGRGYYGPLLDMFDHMIDNAFANPGVRELFDVFQSPDDAVNRLTELDGTARGAARLDLVPSAPRSEGRDAAGA